MERNTHANEHDSVDAVDADADAAQEVRYGSALLAAAGAQLKLSASTCALGHSLYQRYYAGNTSRARARESCVIWVVVGCLLIAVKHADEGAGLRLRDVSCAVYAVHASLLFRDGSHDGERGDERKSSGGGVELDYYGAAGHLWKTEGVRAERRVLMAVGFRVRVELPHKLVLVMCNTLREKSGSNSPANQGRWAELARIAWAFANDVMQTAACVTERPDDVASACVRRAAEKGGIRLPRHWSLVFGGDTDGIKRVDACLDVLYRERKKDIESGQFFKDVSGSGIKGASGTM